MHVSYHHLYLKGSFSAEVFLESLLLTVRSILHTHKVPLWQTIARKANLLPNVLNIFAIPFQENKLISTVYYGRIFLSLHTHSMWETICDAGARSSVKIYLSKSHGIPYSWQRIPPPPTGTAHGGRRDFPSELTNNTPTPELECLIEDLGTSVLSLARINIQILIQCDSLTQHLFVYFFM